MLALSALGYCDGEIPGTDPLAEQKTSIVLLQFSKRAFGADLFSLFLTGENRCRYAAVHTSTHSRNEKRT